MKHDAANELMAKFFVIYYLNDEFLFDLLSPVIALARWPPDGFVVNCCIKILLQI